MLRVATPLPPETEEVISRTIGCCITVHRELGAGLPEHAYAKALGMELTAARIAFEREKRFPVHYRAEFLCDVYLDFVVSNALVLEIKAVDCLAALHHSQTLNYMKIAHIRAGLLVNFNVGVLKEGIRRKLL